MIGFFVVTDAAIAYRVTAGRQLRVKLVLKVI